MGAFNPLAFKPTAFKSTAFKMDLGVTITGNITQTVGAVSQSLAGSVVTPAGFIVGNITQTVGVVTQTMTGSVYSAVHNITGAILQTVGGLSQSALGAVTSVPELPMAYSDYILPVYNSVLARITTGDLMNINHRVSNKGKVRDIPLTATVISRLISMDRLVAYTPEVIQLSTQAQANWSKGIINVQMPEVTTEAIKDANPVWLRGKVTAILETQVLTDTKTSYFSQVEVQIGTIA